MGDFGDFGLQKRSGSVGRHQLKVTIRASEHLRTFQAGSPLRATGSACVRSPRSFKALSAI